MKTQSGGRLRPRSALWALALGFATCAGVTSFHIQSASAHVTLDIPSAKLGTYYKATLRVAHGCSGEATHTVSVAIPEGIIGVKAMPKTGWTLKTIKGAYARTYKDHGRDIAAGVKEIVWSGGNLADDNYDEFVFIAYLADAPADAQAIYLPTTQLCANGKLSWSEIPAEGQDSHALKSPAPALMLVRSNADAHAQVPAETKAGDLSIKAPWSRATPGGAKVAGGFVTITNRGSDADRLTGGSTSIAGRVELHEMAMKGDVMVMRELEKGLELKPGETVELKPGGLHVMFLDLKQPLKEGDTFPVRLNFEKAGAVELMFRVGPAGGGKPTMDHGSKMEHKH